MKHGNWTIEIDPRALKVLRKLPHHIARDILLFVSRIVLVEDNLGIMGKPLSGDLVGFWRHRYGDYRFIAQINDKKLRLLIVASAHRREFYR